MDCKGTGKENNSCPYLKECQIFATYSGSSDKNCIKILNTYCYSDYDKCARYKLKANKKKVPINLLPDGSYIKTSSLRKNLFMAILFVFLLIFIANLGIFYFQINKLTKNLENAINQYVINVKKSALKKE